jgi:hypothetical protein
VAERVIDVLEAVEIEDRDRSLPFAALQQAFERLRHRQAVGEPGELIEMCELAREVAARPIGDIGNRRNSDPSFVEDPDDAAGWKLVGPYFRRSAPLAAHPPNS